MNGILEKAEQFLADEKELLTDLALDTANANGEFEYYKAKASYIEQKARVKGILDTIKMMKNISHQ